MTIGVLALQGDFAEHLEILRSMKVRTMEVRTVEHLRSVHKLILPGGESTTMSLLLKRSGLDAAIRARVHEGSLPVYGTCAGAILLAKNVAGKNPPRGLRLLDCTIERNAYGSQAQSSEGVLKVKGIRAPVHMALIRAPKIVAVGSNVQILASHEGSPMLIREGTLLAGTFHPEVRGNAEIHKLFLSLE